MTTARAIVLTVEDPVGFTPTPSPDPVTALVDDGGSSANTLPSVYQGYTISANLVFAVKYYEAEVEQGTLAPTDIATSFNFSNYGITGTKLSNTKYRISGTVANVISGDTYQFLLKDYTLQILPPNTSEDFYALIRYFMPSPAEPVQLVYPFTITAPDDFTAPTPTSNIAYNVNHWVAWNVQSANTTVRALVAQGEF